MGATSLSRPSAPELSQYVELIQTRPRIRRIEMFWTVTLIIGLSGPLAFGPCPRGVRCQKTDSSRSRTARSRDERIDDGLVYRFE